MRYTIYKYSRVHPNLVQDTSVVDCTFEQALEMAKDLGSATYFEITDENGKTVNKNF